MSIGASPPSTTASMMPRSACGADAASWAASLSVSARRSAAGTTRVTMPSSNARCAVMLWPSRHSSSAAPRPASRSRRCVPPKPGMTPRLISGWPSFAVSAAMRSVHDIAISRPPPSAKPLSSAMTGFPRRSTPRIICWPAREKRSASAGGSDANSEMSAPATNAFCPDPVSTTTRTDASAPAAENAPASSAMVALFSALSLSGRLIVMRRTPAPSSISRFW